MAQLLPATEPFFFPGDRSRAGVLLIHGFTGTPKEMRWMGEYLHAQGYSCLGIRLAGHATCLDDMIRSRWTDWTASVEDGYHLLRGVTDRVVLAGLSMGGVLALLMSTRLEVAAVIAMAAPYRLPTSYTPRQIRLYSYIRRYMPKGDGEPGADWFDKQAYADHVSYPLHPIRSIAELQALLGEMRSALPQVTVPTLLIYSRQDPVVLPESGPSIFEQVGARDKELLWVSQSGHVVTRDAARGEVFEAAVTFLRRLGL